MIGNKNMKTRHSDYTSPDISSCQEPQYPTLHSEACIYNMVALSWRQRTDGSKNSWWKRIVIRIEQSIIIRKISPKHLSLCYLMIIFAYTDIIKEEGG